MASICTLQALVLVLWSLMVLCQGRFYNYPPSGARQYARQGSDLFTMDILMPGIMPKRPEEYLCYSSAAPVRDAYIVQFEPKASMDTIHHMLIFGCKELPYEVDTVHECQGSPCRGKSNILFGWARDAGTPPIPSGVGFYVGGSSGINYIILQLHYGDKLDHLKGTDGDHSGISLVLTHTPQPYIGGIYLLWSGNINIPPRSTNVHADIACKYDGVANIHPFAFRTHAHGLGKVISGYLIRNGEWTTIAKGDPQWPQAFYRMQDSYTIQPGDVIAARCTYDSDRSEAVYAGGTHNDEMCNLYVMYYTDATSGEAFMECGRAAPKTLFMSAPLGYNTPPSHPPVSSNVPHSRSRPPVVNPWETNYYDIFDNAKESYNLGQSYIADYISPGEEEDGADMGRGGEDDGTGSVPEPPAAAAAAADQTGDQVTSSQNPGEGNGDATPAPAVYTPEKGSETSPPTATSQKAQTLTVTDIDGWPSSETDVRLGQVSGVAVDSHGNVHIFHRATRPWDVQSFAGNVFTQKGDGPIKNNTVVKYDSSTGRVIGQWGANQFYLPHGLSIDHEDNIWLTDVAMHQVFKYPPGGADTPLLTLGKKLVPGTDKGHFCKPSDVTVDPKTGNFFVSDGYCNARVMKFSPTGEFLLQWGHQVKGMPLHPPPGQFNLPHCITMATDKDQVCVADREVGRIQCFKTDTGDFVKQFHLPEFEGRLYAVTYTSASGGLLFAVNGPSYKNQAVRGFAINFTSSEILRTWKPQSQEFEKPHDIACTNDGKLVYVAEIGPNKVWKFTTNAEVLNQSVTDVETESFTQIYYVTENMISDTNSTFVPSAPASSQANQSDAGRRSGVGSGTTNDSAVGTTTIIVAVLAVPILLMLLVAIAIRMYTQGNLSLVGKRTRNYKVSGDKFSIGSLLHKRNGFSQVATEDSDPDGGQWSEESDIEEYSILNSKRTQNL